MKYVHCDECGAIMAAARTAEQARRNAKSQGGHVALPGGRDLCQECREEAVTVRAAELLEQAEALSEKVSLGPWEVTTRKINSADERTFIVMDDGEPLAEIAKWSEEADASDAAFIAAARSLVPALAARLRDALTVIEAAREVDESFGEVAARSPIGRLRSVLDAFDAGPAATGETQQLVGRIKTAKNRLEAAETYADALRESEGIHWPALNRSIIERWSHSGLRLVKELAWDLIHEPDDPVAASAEEPTRG